MTNIFTSIPFILFLILASYLVGTYVYRKSKISFLQPVLISIIIIIAVLTWLGIDYKTFEQGSSIINFMLGPSVVALGYVLYEQVEYIKGNVISILTSVIVGSVIGIVSVILFCKAIGCDDIIISSLQPKSVTTPIAISIAQKQGGIISLTAVSVIISGIIGSIIGPFILKKFGVNSKIAKGLAMGSAAHGIGTARAIEIGSIEGAVSGVAIGLMGIATSLLIPIIDNIIKLLN